MSHSSASRTIFTATPAARRELWTLLNSLAVAEMLSPSPELWVVSPWISDIPIIDDTAGRFRVINPSGRSRLGLVELLGLLGDRGTFVSVVTRPNASDQFVNALKNRAALLTDNRIRVLLSDELHAKGWATKTYSIAGSMNFTFSGRGRWDELVTFKYGETAEELLTLFCSRYGPQFRPEGANGS